MKAPFHHKFTYCLLAASPGLNVWLLHEAPSQQEPDSPPKATTVLASQLSAGATKREEFQNGPSSGASNATNPEAVQSLGDTVIKKFSEEDFLYGLLPELPQVPKDTITIDRLREIGAQKPNSEKWKVYVRLLLPKGQSVVLPRFSVGESPFFSAPTLGEPCLVPVQTAAGLAQLELTCTVIAE